jgi:ribosome maturation factor RimP
VKDNMHDKLTGLLAPIAEENELELVLLELAGSQRNPVVRVYLDREGGIGIDDIARANKWLKAILDEVSAYANGYTLEVSSPGIERPLVTLAHFERFAGSGASVTVSPEIAGHKRFTGTISGVEGTDVLFDVDGTTIRVPLRSIVKARLRAEIDFGREGTAEDGL